MARKPRLESKVAEEQQISNDPQPQPIKKPRRKRRIKSSLTKMIRRLEQSRIRTAERRANESLEKITQRREFDRIRKAKIRANESENEAFQRRERDRIRKARKRAQETDQEKFIRRNRDKVQQANRRAKETPAESAMRRQHNRMKRAQGRAKDSIEKSIQQLHLNCLNQTSKLKLVLTRCSTEDYNLSKQNINENKDEEYMPHELVDTDQMPVFNFIGFSALNDNHLERRKEPSIPTTNERDNSFFAHCEEYSTNEFAVDIPNMSQAYLAEVVLTEPLFNTEKILMEVDIQKGTTKGAEIIQKCHANPGEMIHLPYLLQNKTFKSRLVKNMIARFGYYPANSIKENLAMCIANELFSSLPEGSRRVIQETFYSSTGPLNEENSDQTKKCLPSGFIEDHLIYLRKKNKASNSSINKESEEITAQGEVNIHAP